MLPRRTPFLLALLPLLFVLQCSVFIRSVEASLTFSTEDPAILIASFGTAHIDITLLSSEPPSKPVFKPSSLFDVDAVVAVPTSNGGTNYTVSLVCDSGVGVDLLHVSLDSDHAQKRVIVAGFVISHDGQIISGDDGDGAQVGLSGGRSYSVHAVGIDGKPIDISDTLISATESSGPYMKELDEQKTSINSNQFTLVIANNRVGTGLFTIHFTTDAIHYMGETFETILKVTQQTSPPPPCVVYGGHINPVKGVLSLSMFNLRKPPQKSDIRSVILSIGSDDYEWDRAASSLELPDQVVVFKTSASGPASITCDGVAAEVEGPPLNILSTEGSSSGDEDSSTTTSDQLAVSLVDKLALQDGKEILSVEFIVKNSSRNTLSAQHASQIIDAFCDLVSHPPCTLTDLRDGSAILTVSTNVEPSLLSTSHQMLVDAFSDCSFPTSLGYPCDKGADDLTLGSSSAKAIGGSAVAAAGGIATWTIVLIAGIGAFSLLAILMLGLLAVYRRTAEDEESDYSSSLPTGVPETSDDIYDQSIIRDVYGRNEEGGPSVELASRRMQEAEMREEDPMPPSSASSVFAGPRVSDVSSTYSI